MRRALLAACAVLLTAAPGALAGEVSGLLEPCMGDSCRDNPYPTLFVTFGAAPGERNDLSLLPHHGGIRIVDTGADIATDEFCRAVSPNAVRCRAPALSSLFATAFTGDGSDVAIARAGQVYLGRGRDVGQAAAGSKMRGGPGADQLRAWGNGSAVAGGPGRDELVGLGGLQYLAGEAGEDSLAGGLGADRIDGGQGADVMAGGAGADFIFGGAGDDLIHASDPR